MDFIERLFHLSPDGGNGLTEAIWLCGLILAIPAARLWVRQRRARRLSRHGGHDE